MQVGLEQQQAELRNVHASIQYHRQLVVPGHAAAVAGAKRAYEHERREDCVGETDQVTCLEQPGGWLVGCDHT